MAELSAKQHRTLDLLLGSLFSSKSFEPASMQAVRRLGLKYLHHEIRLHDGKILLLTANGLSKFREIERILRTANLISHSEACDISNSFLRVLTDLLSEGKMPDNSHEFIALIRAGVEKTRHQYWYVVPVNGVELEGIDRVQLGELTLIRPSKEELETSGANLSKDFDIKQAFGRAPCLIGSIYGTKSYSKREFGFRANMIIGVIAAVAAASYEDGAAPFRITLEMSATGARAAARYAFWDDDDPDICQVRDWSDHQSLRINKEMADYFQSAPYIQHALEGVAKSFLCEAT
jgi:hypothetical protein